MADQLLIVNGTELLLSSTPAPELLETAQQGPPGPPGAAGLSGGAGMTAIAGEALGGHRAVVLDAAGAAFYADRTTPGHFGRLAGITTGAAILGSPVALARTSTVTEPSWAWTPNAAVFLGLTGLLTQTAPVTGFLQVVGMALSATTLFVNPREPIAIL